jgi:hypothetical protein
MITLGRSPLPPWRELKAPMFDIFLGSASLIIGLVLTIFTMIRCHQRWEFLLIAFWKATLSITLGILSVHAAVVLKKNGFPDGGETVWWIAIYAVGTTIGLTGLASLIFKSWGNRVVVLTCKVFGGVAVVAIVFGWGVAAGRSKYDGRLKLAAFLTLGIVGILAALYSDWVLAGLAGNLIGMPSSDNSLLYFGYFAAKRLPFFSV